jgi:hypothetical protein
MALFVLLLVDGAGVLVVGELMHHPNIGSGVALAVGFCVLLLGGAGALGNLLRWIWDVTSPGQSRTGRGRVLQARGFQRRGVSRG